jgi:hypothetical protein
VSAIARLGEIDRARCRAEAERRFSPVAMARAYENVYHTLLSQRTAVTQRSANLEAHLSHPQLVAPLPPAIAAAAD